MMRAPTRNHSRSELFATQPPRTIVASPHVRRLRMHPLLGVINLRRRPEPHIVIEVRRHRHLPLLISRWIFRQANEDFFQPADPSVAHQFTRIAKLKLRALLAPELQYAPAA